jgi:hypothetical protein
MKVETTTDEQQSMIDQSAQAMFNFHARNQNELSLQKVINIFWIIVVNKYDFRAI